MLRVKGNGNGISQDLFKTFQTNGAAFGIGLSGLRELSPIQPTPRSPSQFLWERASRQRPAEFTSRL
jgi:hypothetical protein